MVADSTTTPCLLAIKLSSATSRHVCWSLSSLAPRRYGNNLKSCNHWMRICYGLSSLTLLLKLLSDECPDENTSHDESTLAQAMWQATNHDISKFRPIYDGQYMIWHTVSSMIYVMALSVWPWGTTSNLTQNKWIIFQEFAFKNVDCFTSIVSSDARALVLFCVIVCHSVWKIREFLRNFSLI